MRKTKPHAKQNPLQQTKQNITPCKKVAKQNKTLCEKKKETL